MRVLFVTDANHHQHNGMRLSCSRWSAYLAAGTNGRWSSVYYWQRSRRQHNNKQTARHTHTHTHRPLVVSLSVPPPPCPSVSLWLRSAGSSIDRAVRSARHRSIPRRRRRRSVTLHRLDLTLRRRFGRSLRYVQERRSVAHRRDKWRR